MPRSQIHVTGRYRSDERLFCGCRWVWGRVTDDEANSGAVAPVRSPTGERL